jgi:hypothetical protein
MTEMRAAAPGCKNAAFRRGAGARAPHKCPGGCVLFHAAMKSGLFARRRASLRVQVRRQGGHGPRCELLRVACTQARARTWRSTGV